MSLKEIIERVIIWRLLIFAIAVLGFFILTPKTTFTNLTPTPSVSDLGNMWSNFDGIHYLAIAEYGYGYSTKTDKDYAFFPVYPWLISKTNIFGSYLASGLIITHLCLVFAIYYLYKLIILDKSSKVAKTTIALFLFFPTSFFLGSTYNESLFLLLSVLIFYLVRKQNFFLAALLAAIASATRVTGILFWAVIVYEYWLTNGKKIKEMVRPEAVWLTLPPLGLLSYMQFQFIKTGDPLFFFHIQSQYAERSTSKIILLYQVFYRYFKMLIFVDHTNPIFLNVVVEFLCACLVVAFAFFAYKKTRFSYWMYTVIAFLLPTFTGTFTSLPRYILVLFPVFVFLAEFFESKNPIYKKIYFTVCTIIGILSIILFTRGYFIA